MHLVLLGLQLVDVFVCDQQRSIFGVVEPVQLTHTHKQTHKHTNKQTNKHSLTFIIIARALSVELLNSRGQEQEQEENHLVLLLANKIADYKLAEPMFTLYYVLFLL